MPGRTPLGKSAQHLFGWAPQKHATTRMFTAAADVSGVRMLDANGLTSHVIWRDERNVLTWSEQPSHGKAWYLFKNQGDWAAEPVGVEVMRADGHCIYVSGNVWLMNDRYPDQQRNQNPSLDQVDTDRRVTLGHFRSPPEYPEEWCCDSHPRFSPDGQTVVIDSPTTPRDGILI